MSILDWIIIGIILLFVLLGFLIGFGRGLKFLTKGFFGILISLLICHWISGILINFSFVSETLANFRGVFEGKEEWYFKLLLSIRIDVIVYYVVLFIIVQIIRIIIVSIITRILESENVVLIVINRLFGIVLFVCMLIIITMVVFQIIKWIGGETEIKFVSYLKDSIIMLNKGTEGEISFIEWFYTNNPLIKLIEFFKIRFEFTKTEIVPMTSLIPFTGI